MERAAKTLHPMSPCWLSSRNFFQGVKSIVMQISFVMLLFSDQISGGAKVSMGANCLRGGAPLWKKASLCPCERSRQNHLEHTTSCHCGSPNWPSFERISIRTGSCSSAAEAEISLPLREPERGLKGLKSPPLSYYCVKVVVRAEILHRYFLQTPGNYFL